MAEAEQAAMSKACRVKEKPAETECLCSKMKEQGHEKIPGNK